jgi:hypothetical protein
MLEIDRSKVLGGQKLETLRTAPPKPAKHMTADLGNTCLDWSVLLNQVGHYKRSRNQCSLPELLKSKDGRVSERVRYGQLGKKHFSKINAARATSFIRRCSKGKSGNWSTRWSFVILE